MSYDPLPYWADRGRRYEAEHRPDRFVDQETVLAGLLEELAHDGPIRTVLDVGCGFGRIGSIIRDHWPAVAYTGLDLSVDQLEAARRHLPDAELIASTIQDFDAGGRRWDLVIAAEVLMHQPPGWQLGAAVAKLEELSARYIVTIDWTAPMPDRAVAAHNFRHDYRALFGPEAREIHVGEQSIWLRVSHAVSHHGADPAVSSGPERDLGGYE